MTTSGSANVGGIAAHDGLVVAAMKHLDRLLFVDVRTNRLLGEASVARPGGLAFDGKGRLLVLSKSRLLRYALTGPGLPSSFPPRKR